MEPNTLLQDIPYTELKGAYHHLQKKNKDLLDGLYYAAFVQQGLMPQSRHFRKLNQDYFIMYNPLQIIGGDFFWIGKKENWQFYAVGDCTGHGVSGAMLSALAIGFLNYVVYSKNFDKIGDILTEIDKKWIETFNHRDDVDVNNDWLEMSLIAYNTETCEVQFTGAGSSVFIIDQNQNSFSYRGNAYPIGGWQIEPHRSFDTVFLNIEKGSRLYLFSDGLKDQFGGQHDKRMGSARLKYFIKESAHLKCIDQKKIIEIEFNLWKHTTEQTDDVCLLRIDL